MIKTLLVAHRDRDRLAQILGVASRFGLGALFARLGLQRGGNADDSQEQFEQKTLPHRTRLALEELGPTFVKLGQILGTRRDLLSAEWIDELAKLHSSAPTLPFDALRPAVEEALGQPIEETFAHFDPTPLAAASMAQVHRATLKDGREVVLKIRRPGIRPRMEADLRLIAQLAAVAEAANADLRRFAPAALVRQLASAVLEELDFTTEGRNADGLRADFARNPSVIVPEIHWAWTSETLLVMDFISGIHPKNGEVLQANGIDPAAIASLGATIVLDMVLVNGRFHGDPHPGNLMCLKGNRIALLDLGMVGHVSPRRREEFISFTQSLTLSDPDQLADILAMWSDDGTITKDQVQSAAERLILRHGGQKIVLSAMVTDFMALIREEGMTVPPDLLLIFKALITIDGVLSGISPEFDLSEAMRRSALRVAQSRLSPEHWGPTLQTLAWEMSKLGDDAPRLLRAALRRIEAEPKTALDTASLATAMKSSAHWIAAAIFGGAALISAAIFLQVAGAG